MKKSIIKPQVKRILVFTLSNFGDVVLTLPLVTSIRVLCPKVEIDLLVGDKVYDFLVDNPFFRKVIAYDKSATLKEKWQLLKGLRSRKYDFVLDFRNSLLPYLVGRPSRSLALNTKIKKIESRYERYEKLRELLCLPQPDTRKLHLYRSLDCERLTEVLRTKGVYSMQNILLVSPGARSYLKRWPAAYFADVINRICATRSFTVVLIGDAFDVDACDDVESNLTNDEVVNLAGKINPRQFAFLVERSCLVLSNDSATMHLAHYYNRPVVGLFGPTDPKKYGRASERSRIACIDHDWRTIEAMSDEAKREAFAQLTPETVAPLVEELLSQS